MNSTPRRRASAFFFPISEISPTSASTLTDPSTRLLFDSWLWVLFNKERSKRNRAKFTNHIPDKRIRSALPVPVTDCTVGDLRAIRDSIAQTPEGGALVFIIALINYASAENHQAGVKMAILSMWEENIVESNAAGNLNGYVLHRSDAERLNRANMAIAASYVAGTAPENDYTIPDPTSIEIGFRAQSEYSGSEASGTKKVFVWSSGADTARPLTLKRNVNGVWKVAEFSSLVVGVRPPASEGRPAERAANAL